MVSAVEKSCLVGAASPRHCSSAGPSPLAEGQSMDSSSSGSFSPLPALPQPRLVWLRVLSPRCGCDANSCSSPGPSPHKPSYHQRGNGKCLCFLGWEQLSPQRLGYTNLPPPSVAAPRSIPWLPLPPQSSQQSSAFGPTLADLPSSLFPRG